MGVALVRTHAVVTPVARGAAEHGGGVPSAADVTVVAGHDAGGAAAVDRDAALRLRHRLRPAGVGALRRVRARGVGDGAALHENVGRVAADEDAAVAADVVVSEHHQSVQRAGVLRPQQRDGGVRGSGRAVNGGERQCRDSSVRGRQASRNPTQPAPWERGESQRKRESKSQRKPENALVAPVNMAVNTAFAHGEVVGELHAAVAHANVVPDGPATA